MIIFINGSINSGKSTVSSLITKVLPRFALIEIDYLRDMVSWMPLSESIPINLKNAASVIRNFAAEGISSVVPYPLSEKNYLLITDLLKDLNEEIRVFTLAPSLEEALKDRGERMLEESERERIKYHYEIGIPNPSFGITINTTNLTPEETLQLILSEIKK